MHREHRGFETLGTDAYMTRNGFANGWPTVLQSFAAHASGRPPGES